jgi:hypothetical protein
LDECVKTLDESGTFKQGVLRLSTKGKFGKNLSSH